MKIFGNVVTVDQLEGYSQSKEDNLASLVPGPAIEILGALHQRRIRVELVPYKVGYKRVIKGLRQVIYQQVAISRVFYKGKLVYSEFFVNPGKVNTELLEKMGQELTFSATVQGKELKYLRKC